MAGDGNEYKLEAKTLGVGGYAEVFGALHVPTASRVAFKRLRSTGDDGVRRLRREIEALARINNRHVMPLLDAASDGSWYTMPIADSVLGGMRVPMAAGDVERLVIECSIGLEAAHAIGMVHRDVTPNNIMLLKDGNAIARWVVADWGLVRRPHGQTSGPLTESNERFATRGFAAPELDDDAHEADERADIYGLGRIAAWALTGKWPKQNVLLLPDGDFRRFVARATEFDHESRPSSMADTRQLLAETLHPPETALARLTRLAAAAEAGDVTAGRLLLVDAASGGDESLFLDFLPRVPGQPFTLALAESTDAVRRIFANTCDAIIHMNTFDRGWSGADRAIDWLRRELSEITRAGAVGILEDTATQFFKAETRRDQWAGRRSTHDWLRSLRGDQASAVARALANADGGDWYAGDWSAQGADIAIRSVIEK